MLEIHRGHRRDAQAARRHDLRVGVVRERDVRADARRPPSELSDPVTDGRHLGRPSARARASDHLDVAPTLPRELERLRVVAGSDDHVVPSFDQPPADRREQKGMGRIREVDPDLHARGPQPVARNQRRYRLCRLSANDLRRCRSAAWPSHPGGRVRPVRLPAASAAGISAIRDGSSPSSVLVPALTVTGRSVLSRSVKHGTPEVGGLLLHAAGVREHGRRRRPRATGTPDSPRGSSSRTAGSSAMPSIRLARPRVDRKHDR